MRAPGSSPEIPLPTGPRRVRRQRLLCLGFLPLLALPLLLVSGPFAPVDQAAPVALRSVPGTPSRTTAPSAPAAVAVPARRAAAPEVPTTLATTTTSTTIAAPEAKAVTAPTTTVAHAAPTTAAPAALSAPAGGAIAPAAARPAAAPATTAPRPTTTTSTTTSTTTTTTAPPAPSPHRQSGQATWYRWKRGNCAHNSLPLGTRVTVTAVATGRTTTCVVGDRGGFRNPTIIDLDASVFEQISPLGAGRIAVVISW